MENILSNVFQLNDVEYFIEFYWDNISKESKKFICSQHKVNEGRTSPEPSVFIFIENFIVKSRFGREKKLRKIKRIQIELISDFGELFLQWQQKKKAELSAKTAKNNTNIRRNVNFVIVKPCVTIFFSAGFAFSLGLLYQLTWTLHTSSTFYSIVKFIALFCFHLLCDVQLCTSSL